MGGMSCHEHLLVPKEKEKKRERTPGMDIGGQGLDVEKKGKATRRRRELQKSGGTSWSGSAVYRFLAGGKKRKK